MTSRVMPLSSNFEHKKQRTFTTYNERLTSEENATRESLTFAFLYAGVLRPTRPPRWSAVELADPPPLPAGTDCFPLLEPAGAVPLDGVAPAGFLLSLLLLKPSVGPKGRVIGVARHNFVLLDDRQGSSARHVCCDVL